MPQFNEAPTAWLIETFAEDGKECLNSQFVVIPSVAALFDKPYHRVTPLFASWKAADNKLTEALEEISDMCPATAEMTLAHDMAQIASDALAALSLAKSEKQL